jgi:deazaflavin-dependent oxidoreductase (nitroreductase family)
MDQPPQLASAPITRSRGLALIRRLARPIWMRVGVVASLEVADRRTGRPAVVTLAPWKVDSGLYLMSQYGVTAWVHNIRAAGRGTLRRKGGSQAFSAIEVDGEERDRVIASFQSATPRPFRRDFDKRPGAADHPTFRLEPIG